MSNNCSAKQLELLMFKDIDLFMSNSSIQNELFLQWDRIKLSGVVLAYSVGLIIINLDKF